MFRSLKVQIGVTLGVQLVILVSIVSMTLYRLDLRKHDYLILNLSGQLRVISQLLVNHSTAYADNAPRNFKSYYRDVALYNQQLNSYIQRYDRIIESFRARQLSPELFQSEFLSVQKPKSLVGKISEEYEPVYCKWNSRARNQLVVASEFWYRFKQGLNKELGTNQQEPRLEAAAQYILLNEDSLMQSATDLTNAFRNMMEEKLSEITLLNRASILLSILMAITVFFMAYRKIFRPVEQTVQGFQRVARGELTHQLEVSDTLELGKLTGSFNQLTARLNSLFGLTDRINQAKNLDEIIEYVYEEFSGILPIDWVGMLRTDVSVQKMTVAHAYSDIKGLVREGDDIAITNPCIQQVYISNDAFCFNSLEEELKDKGCQSELFENLVKMDMQSLLAFPVSIMGNEKAILLFATSEKSAYNTSHQELLTNISSHVSHAFERSIGIESLVISAVEGLAKLAESRDPETGDHLERMSLYSYVIAREMLLNGNDKGELKNSFPRHVFYFAPMHDIGKVGVEDSILLKPGKLTEEQRQEMQKHPVIGADVLRKCELQVNKAGFSIFKTGIEIAESHHEKFDGSGYPYQLKGDKIPLSARIVALADVFDALTSRRPYKEAWPVEKALEVIRDESGKHFDPKVVNAFENALPEILKIYEKRKHV